MKGYLGLILELLVLSWRRAPLLTAGMFGILALSVVAVPGTGLALRSAMDASVGDNARVAVLCALAAAAAYAVTATIVGIRQSLRVLLVEQVGVIDLNEQIHRDIAGIEEIDHLENPEFLDRVTVLRNAAWEIMAAAWSAVDACFAILQLVVSLVFLGVLSPWLLILVAFAAGPLWFQRRGRVAVERAEVGSAESYRLQQQLFELATSAAEGKEIRTAGVGEELARRQAAAWDEALRQRTRARLVNAAWRLGGWLFFLSGFLTGLALVVHRARTGQGSVGDVMLTITVAANLQFAVQAAAAGSSGAAGATRLMQPLLWLRRYAARDRAGRMGTAEAPRRLSRGITIERLCFTYPTAGSPTVDDVSVHIPAGRVVALVGEYGSGKTTLVKLLAKLYRPDQGRILVDGVDLATVDTASWRSRLSGAFQDFGRFHVTFAEAVGIGDPQRISDRAAVERAVRAADASGLVASLPHGLDTQLGRRFGGVDLSEGQWQKTALARASMRAAPLLFVLDEPTASLDAPSEHAVFERYMAQAREHAASTGAITLVVSHRFSTVTSADLILVLEGGRLVESGTHRELMLAHGRYAALYGIQQAAYSAVDAAPSG